MNVRISQSARQRIVSRINGGTTVITAAAIQTPEELAYAVRFLMDHVVYKRSKEAGEVDCDAAGEALAAVEAATDSFMAEVLKEEEAEDNKPVSGLGEGKIVNPYTYVA